MNPQFSQQQMAAVRTLQQQILGLYRSQHRPTSPWQQTVSPEERAHSALQLSTSLGLLREGSPQDHARSGMQMENRIFTNSNSKEHYMSTIRSNLQQFQEKRQQRTLQLQQQQQQQQQQQVQHSQQPQGPQQPGTMNPMAMMGQGGVPNQRPNAQQLGPNNFPNPQLQRQMQASPIPMSQTQSSMGLGSANGPNVNMQAQQNPPSQNNPRAQTMGQGSNQLTPQQHQQINDHARRTIANATPELREKIRQVIDSWPAGRREGLMARQIDLEFFAYREHLLAAAKMPGMQRPHQPGAPGAPPAPQPGQPNPMANAAFLMNQQQQGIMNAAPDFNMQIANQQREALRAGDQGQQVVPASNNTPGGQMMNGFQGLQQPGQAQNALAQAQAQRAMAQRQQTAQNQAAATQQMLLRQQHIGNMNGQPGPQQSPMPLLTRPIGPQGPGPSTPQPQQQPQVAQMNPMARMDPARAAQFAQMVQARLAATGGQLQNLTPQSKMAMLEGLPVEMRNHLMTLSDDQFRNLFQKLGWRKAPMAPGAPFAPGQPQPGLPNMAMNPAQALQLGIPPGQMMNGPNMGNMNHQPRLIPGQQLANGQVPPQMMPQNPESTNQQQQRIHQAQQLLRNNLRDVLAVDSRPFPPGMVSNPLSQHLPPEVKTWGQLKAWVNQNPAIAANMPSQRILILQAMSILPELERRSQQAMRQQQQQGLAGQRFTPQPNGANQAPQARMATGPGPGQFPPRPGPQQLQQPGMPVGGPQITPQNLANFRAQLPPHQRHIPEDQVLMLWQMKRQQLQQQHNQMNQPPMVTQPQSSRPPAQAPATQPAPARAANKAAPAPKSAPAPAQTTAKQPNKRTHDEANLPDASSQNVAPQAPPMAVSKSQQGTAGVTPQQIANMTPEQHQHAQVREGLLKAQNLSTKVPQDGAAQLPSLIQGGPLDPVKEKRLQHFYAQADQVANKLVTPINLTPEQRQEMQRIASDPREQHWFEKVPFTLRVFISRVNLNAQNENLINKVACSRAIIMKQLKQVGSGFALVDQPTITPEAFKTYWYGTISFVAKMQKTEMQKTEKPPSTQAPVPANTSQEQGQRQQGIKPPPPATSGKPPFALSGPQPSQPNGSPTYFGNPMVNPDNLHLPKHKKQKLGHPGAPPMAPTPQTAPPKTGPPEVRRSQQAEQPAHKCKESGCDYSFRGFSTATELDAHVKEAHAPVEDPLQFALEAVAEYCGIDPSTDRPREQKAVPAASQVVKPIAHSQKLPSQSAKTAQTPNVATPLATQVAATPVNHATAQAGAIKSSPSSTLLKTPQTGAKVATPSTGAANRTTSAGASKSEAKEADSGLVIPWEMLEEDWLNLPTMNGFTDELLYIIDNGPNGPLTVQDIGEDPRTWPEATPGLTSDDDSPAARHLDTPDDGNAQQQWPAAWSRFCRGDSGPIINEQISESLKLVGYPLPPMDNTDDSMLFFNDSMMDIDDPDSKTATKSGALDSALAAA